MQQMPDFMPRWQYHIEYIYTDVSDPQTKDFLATRYPRQRLSRYAAQAALKRLEDLGDQGWELVHMEPVDLGDNGDIRIGGQTATWTNTYFCVFKRPVRRS